MSDGIEDKHLSTGAPRCNNRGACKGDVMPSITSESGLEPIVVQKELFNFDDSSGSEPELKREVEPTLDEMRNATSKSHKNKRPFLRSRRVRPSKLTQRERRLKNLENLLNSGMPKNSKK